MSFPLPASCTDPAVVCWIDAHSGIAAWIQGIGALIALAIAISLPIVDRRRELNRKRQALWSSVEFAVEQTRSVHYAINAEISGTPVLSYPVRLLEVADMQLEAAPLYEVESASAARYVASLRGNVQAIAESINKLKNIPNPDKRATAINHARDPIRKLCRDAEKQAKALRTALEIELKWISEEHREVFPKGYGEDEGF